jgi:hypothetical protein
MGVESGVVEALDCLSLHQLCGRIASSASESQKRSAERRAVSAGATTRISASGGRVKRRAQASGGNRLARDHQDLHDVPPTFPPRAEPFGPAYGPSGNPEARSNVGVRRSVRGR